MEVLFLVPSLKAPDFQARQSLKQFDAKELPLGVRCGCLKAGYSPKWPMGREHSDTPADCQTPNWVWLKTRGKNLKCNGWSSCSHDNIAIERDFAVFYKPKYVEDPPWHWMTVSFDVQFWTFLQHFQAQVPDSLRNLRPQRLIFNYPLYYTARFPELIRYFEVLLRQVVRVDPLMTW